MLKKICMRCGRIDEAVESTPGSGWIELVLWLFFLLPGLIYSIWRLSRRHEVCRHCGAADLLDLDAPVAAKFMRDQGIVPPVVRPLDPVIPSETSKRLGRALGRVVGRLLR